MTPTATSVTLDSTASIPADVLVQEVGGETVLLDMAGGQYFGLDPVGTRIWQLLGELGRLRDVHQRLCGELDADHERIAEDLLAVARSLADAGLVRIA